MIDKICTDRVIAAQRNRHEHLGANAIGAGREHGISISLQGETTTEAADAFEHPRVAVMFEYRLIARDRFVCKVDMNARFGIRIRHITASFVAYVEAPYGAPKVALRGL